jgi:hypothetical protein
MLQSCPAQASTWQQHIAGVRHESRTGSGPRRAAILIRPCTLNQAAVTGAVYITRWLALAASVALWWDWAGN